jgi:hypothetical protein
MLVKYMYRDEAAERVMGQRINVNNVDGDDDSLDDFQRLVLVSLHWNSI